MSEPNGTASTGALRVWPVLLIVAAQFAASYLLDRYGSSHLHGIAGNFGVHVLSAVAIMIWWMRSGGVPQRERRIGLVLVVVALAALFLSQLPTTRGRFLIAHALPALTLGVALILAVTARVSWPLRRNGLVVFIVGCTAVYCAMRVQVIAADFSVQTAWRWAPHSAQQASDAARVDVHGVATLPAAVGPLDWPGFRGPARDGRVVGVTFGTDWRAAPPALLWRHPVGPGHGSMAIVGDYLFTQEQADTMELVSCYSAKTGEPVWTNSIHARHDDTLGGAGPRATPTYANGKLYAQSASGLLQCLDAANGNVLWKQDLSTPEAPDPPLYGFASSPLVVDDLVLQFCSGAGRNEMIAFDAATGAERWSAAKDTGGYGSPHFAALGGVPQVLMLHSAGLQSFVPTTGAMLWEHAWPKRMFPRCLQPLPVDGESIALGATSDFGTRLVQVKKNDAGWDVKEEWTNGSHRPYFNDNVGHAGFCYGFDGNRLCALDLKTGERKWQGNRYGGQLIVVAEMDMLLVLTEKGKAALVKADPTAFTEVARLDAISGKSWNHPAIAHGNLFVRNSEEMACYTLPAAMAASAAGGA